MQSYICTTCGVAYPPSDAPPAACPICADERQYVNAAGQSWTTLAELQARPTATTSASWSPGSIGIGATPAIAIGQRALFIAQPGGGVMWDCTPLITDEAVASIKALGGAPRHRDLASALLHRHGRLERAFGGVPIYLHADHRAVCHAAGPDTSLLVGRDPSTSATA